MKLTWLGSLLLAYSVSVAQTPGLHFEGVRVWVDDLPKATRFYTHTLGFELVEELPDGNRIDAGALNLYLSKAEKPNTTDYELHTRTGMAIEVHKLLPAIDRLRKAGVIFEEAHLQRNGVGISIPFRDPAGNLLSLIEVQVRDVAPFEGFRAYNAGITSADMAQASVFYTDHLPFEVWSEDYLPQALPLKHEDGSFAFMLHMRPGLVQRNQKYGQDSDLNLVFSSKHMVASETHLRSKGFEVSKGPTGKSLVVKDPFGNYCEIIEK